MCLLQFARVNLTATGKKEVVGCLGESLMFAFLLLNSMYSRTTTLHRSSLAVHGYDLPDPEHCECQLEIGA
jgi:hypothetical protein